MSLKRFRGSTANNIRTNPNSDDRFFSGTGGKRVLYEAVVVDFFSNPVKDLQKSPINDPDLTYKESLAKGVNKVRNTNLILKMPRKSLTAVVTSDKESWAGGDPEIFYPLFPHLCMPVKPGEKIWVIYETLSRKRSNKGYWVTRITSDINVDDPNYTHYDRQYLYDHVPREESALSTGASESPWDDDLIYSFLPGANANLRQNTMPGDDPYNSIVGSSLSYKEQFTGEPVPRFSPRLGDLVLEGSNNTLICLGQDRPALQMADESSPGVQRDEMSTGTGTIDIVAGRGYSTQTTWAGEIEIEKRAEDLSSYYESNKFPTYNGVAEENINEGDPGFDTDFSRVYISMKTDGDSNFNLSHTYASQITESPYIVAKSTEIRLVGRGSVRATAESGAEMSLMSNGEAALIGSRVFLGAPSSTHGESDHYHVVRAEILLQAWDTMLTAFNTFADGMTDTMAGILGNFGAPVVDTTMATAVSGLRDGVQSARDLVEESFSDIVHTE